MNYFNFDHIGGFPFTANILKGMQSDYSILEALGSLAGNLTIISGCITTGSNVSDGVVFINGEILKFVGGNAQTKVIIKENVQNLLFQDQNYKDVIHTRYVTFGTGIEFNLWADFKRGFETKQIPDALAGKADAAAVATLIAKVTELEKKCTIFQAGGGMFYWNKPFADIPPGFEEVTNWRGRIAVGLDPDDVYFNSMGKEGGSKTKTLTLAEIPEHAHDFEASTDNIGGNGNVVRIDTNTTGQTATSSIAGEGEEFSIMNPYRVVLFIEYVA